MTAAKTKTHPAASKARGLRIENLPLDQILPYERNARIHPAEQQKLLRASIEQFGFVNPCLVDENGTLIAGHNRAAVAAQMGLKTIPVIRLAHLSEDDAKALRLADNAIPLHAGWNTEMLNLELADLEKLDYDVERFGLTELDLPDLEIADGVPKRERKKVTIFVSVNRAEVDKANKLIATALNKAKIAHNL